MFSKGDSAASNKNAFKNIYEFCDETLMIAEMIAKQKKLNLLEEKKQKDEKKRELAVLEMNESIEEFNTVASNEIKEKPKTREQLLLEFDNDEDDETEEILDQSDNEEDITIIETEFDELCGEEELDNEIANLDNDLHVYKKKVVC